MSGGPRQRSVTESLDSECLFGRGRKPTILHILDQRWVLVQLPIKRCDRCLTNTRLRGPKTRQVSTESASQAQSVGIYAHRRLRAFVVTQFAVIMLQCVVYAFSFPPLDLPQRTDVDVSAMQALWNILYAPIGNRSFLLAKRVIGNVVIAFTTTGYPYIPLVCLPCRLCTATYSIPEWIWQGLVNSLCQCILIWSANAFLAAIRLVSICHGSMPS